MVLRLTIEPDGSVSMCVLQSTDMDAPDLATQVVSRVRTMNFGAKDGVAAVTIVYPIDFLPAELKMILEFNAILTRARSKDDDAKSPV